MTIPADERPRARADLAWAISVGGVSVVLFTAMLVFTWYFAATLLLIFTGMLLGLGLNALTGALGRRVQLPHPVRLAIVCIALALMLAGVAYLGGATIAEQASLLSKTIKSQITNVRSFLENHGIDTSFFDLGNAASDSSADAPASSTPSPAAPTRGPLPGAGALASSGGAIVSQTFKLLLGTIHGVGNIFIVLFLGLSFAAQPGVYHDGLLFLAPAKHRTRVTLIIDRTAETLERWLIAQITVMLAVGAVTWIGLAIIGIPGAFILGIQAGLLAFIPTVGAIIAGVIVVLASLASGWIAALSALLLFLGVHAMESYVLTPLLQRQALDIPPATLFAFQILLGVVFGIWGLALALPLVAIAKVMIDHFKTYEAPSLTEAA
ncbi:AI-2E family transporter [Bradyrhizobium sp. 180]|uniref:AI-2E family transporter n=1 Tax=unclassified Bradyrhizobium TaxID=2631580 RepID=UPI001FF7A140|nr:AI-2E family transporter [Bradyrhizobium sp. CW12]MCK1489791.1 AI-2E family transporter [Bradyrhizobium sp. 180]MCK1532425.1 AI-2E family transporter [Bradyrhizobium sp. 182]MCK1595611.1 AI-2E family transporter [Bradyrhizobium sp. 164]MCK1618446.1 AI-2E family transporter [Bradyrhizobium sp. 159]MCK1647277.1 AI-2E family transporter [Bradyrhizobium sp. 154]